MLSTIKINIKNNSPNRQTVDLFDALQNTMPPAGVSVSVFGGYEALLREIAQGKDCVNNIHYYSSRESQLHHPLTFGSSNSSGHNEQGMVTPSAYVNASQPSRNVVDIPVDITLGKTTLTTTIDPETTVNLTLQKCRSGFAGFAARLLKWKIRKNPVRCLTC